MKIAYLILLGIIAFNTFVILCEMSEFASVLRGYMKKREEKKEAIIEFIDGLFSNLGKNTTDESPE